MDNNKRVSLSATTNATITVQELGRAILQHVMSSYFEPGFNDAGCDWFVSQNDPVKVYIGSTDWLAASDREIGTLVMAAQILMFGTPIYIEDYEHGRTGRSKAQE